jgi:pimeloyl-ACP methyl ester carboxylesterase
MDHVGWRRAHLVGHSYGALVALQLALDAPERVASVALLEPAAQGISSSEQVVAALQPVIAAYRSGETPGAVDAFLRHVCGDGYRAALNRASFRKPRGGLGPRRRTRPGTCAEPRPPRAQPRRRRSTRARRQGRR